MVMTTPVTLDGSTVGSSTQAGTRVGMHGSPRSSGVQRPAASSAAMRRKNVAAVEGGAGPADAEARQLRGVESHDRGVRVAADDRRQQAIVRREEDMAPRRHRDDVARGARPPDPPRRRGPCPAGNTRTTRASQNPASAGQWTTISCVRSTIRASAKRRQDATLHDADERALVPEVGGDGDDARRA